MNDKRKKAEEFILKYIDKVVVGGKDNYNLYKETFKKMSDKEFDSYMKKLQNDEVTLSVIIPNGGKLKVDTENNFKLGKELGCDFFQHLIFKGNKDLPDYKTPHKYLILKLPIKRQAQLLIKKISIPEDNKSVDLLSGQVTGKSKGSKLTMPEVQILAGMGLKKSINELMTIRGGDLSALNALENMLYRNGSATQDEVNKYGQGVVSKATLKSFWNASHIKSTL